MIHGSQALSESQGLNSAGPKVHRRVESGNFDPQHRQPQQLYSSQSITLKLTSTGLMSESWAEHHALGARILLTKSWCFNSTYLLFFGSDLEKYMYVFSEYLAEVRPL